MLSFAAVFLLLFVETDTTADFDDFIAAYGKSYAKGTAEYARREQIFENSRKRHEILNRGRVNEWDAIYGVNRFSDLTPSEFAEQFLMSSSVAKNATRPASPLVENWNAETMQQKSFDWRDKGVLTSIRNQKQCGSCWAFSVVETIESHYAIQSNVTPVPLSPQQFISCDSTSDGCKGGDIEKAMEWAESNDVTIVPEKAYPFTSGDGKDPSCITNLVSEGVKVVHHNYSKFISMEREMIPVLMTYGPMSVAVDASTWQDYISGIIQHHCPSFTLDHAVQVVGYNFEGPVPYWIVRNTWGTGWGLDGYVYIKYDGNLCGIAEQVVWVLETRGVNL
ncbi:cathepsin O-like [Oscarella lobularis]|uniref:cathepsin O-like n=1 Tax=Oscarella lobularis TaxID=121494 RepID=UPI003314064D